MKRKAISIIICVVLLMTTSIVAYAAYGNTYTAHYKKGNNYSSFTGISSQTKVGYGSYNAMVGYNKSSWTTPKTGVVDNSAQHIAMTGQYSITNNSSLPMTVPSYAETNHSYNIIVVGSVNQVGTDTMSFKYDLDAQ